MQMRLTLAHLSLYCLAAKFQRDTASSIDLPKSCFESIHSCDQRFLARANLPSFENIGNNSGQTGEFQHLTHRLLLSWLTRSMREKLNMH